MTNRLEPLNWSKSDPLVKELIALMVKHNVSAAKLSGQADIGENTLREWQTRQPLIDTFRRAVQGLGYDLRIVPMESDGVKLQKMKNDQAAELCADRCYQRHSVRWTKLRNLVKQHLDAATL